MRGLLNLLKSIAIGAGELLSNGVKSLNGAASGIKSTSNSAVCARLLIDVGNEVLLVAASLVCNGLGGAFGEELDCGVGGNALLLGSTFCVWSFGVNFGDQDSRFGDEICGEGFPGRSKRLAICMRALSELGAS